MRGVVTALLSLASLLASCAHTSGRTQPPFERTAEIAQSISLHGLPMSPKQVSEQAAELIGRTVLVEGFVAHLCNEFTESDCASSADRFLIFGNGTLPPAPGPERQACPLDGNGLGDRLLIGGHLPAGFKKPGNRRALIQGAVARRSVTVSEGHPGKHSYTYFDFEYDFVLDDVTVLALYDSRCDWPH